MKPSKVVTGGFALVAALFLIVVLAGLGLFAVHLSSAQQQSATLSLLGSRATAAANTGISYMATRAITGGALACVNTTLPLNQRALSGFTVNIVCAATSVTNPPACAIAPCNVYEITATATYGTYGTPNFVSRSANRTVTNVP